MRCEERRPIPDRAAHGTDGERTGSIPSRSRRGRDPCFRDAFLYVVLPIRSGGDSWPATVAVRPRSGPFRKGFRDRERSALRRYGRKCGNSPCRRRRGAGAFRVGTTLYIMGKHRLSRRTRRSETGIVGKENGKEPRRQFRTAALSRFRLFMRFLRSVVPTGETVWHRIGMLSADLRLERVSWV